MFLSVGMKLVLEPLQRQTSSELHQGIGKESSGRICMINFFFLFSQILKMNSFSGYRILLWPESVINGSQETVGQWSIYHLFLLWHSFHPFNFVIRSSFTAKPGRIFPFSFLCFLCLISFASLCLLNQVSLQVWWCLRTITEWITPSKMLFSKYSQPV